MPINSKPLFATVEEISKIVKRGNGSKRVQPVPRTPGITKKMVRVHASRLFRDVMLRRSLHLKEWHSAEVDLLRMLESDGY